MVKPAKTAYVCTECGATFPKWAGQCTDCGAWNTLEETVPSSAPEQGRFAGYAGEVPAAIRTLADVSAEDLAD